MTQPESSGGCEGGCVIGDGVLATDFQHALIVVGGSISGLRELYPDFDVEGLVHVLKSSARSGTVDPEAISSVFEECSNEGDEHDFGDAFVSTAERLGGGDVAKGLSVVACGACMYGRLMQT